MSKKLFPLSYPSLETPAASLGPKFGCLGAVLELLLVSSSPILRPVVSSNTFSTSGIATCKLHLFLNRRPFSTNQANFLPGRGFGIGRAVISRCSLFSKNKADAWLDNYSSLPEILKKYGNLCPEIIRRFWRVSTLSPGDFLELSMSFEAGKDSIFMVEFLWTLFNWAPRQSRNFHHLPRSYEIMISMLIRSQMFADAESLVLSSNPSGIFSNTSEMFSNIIQGYAENFLLQNAVALYNKAVNQGLELSCSCYQALLNLLVEEDNSELAIRVYMDMMESEFGLWAEGRLLDYVVGSLCKDGKTFEAVKILRQARTAGFKANPGTLDAVVLGYCCKKDYEDVLNFMKEWAHIPSSSVVNKVISSICRKLGSDYAWFFTQELKALRAQIDHITFGILIVRSCKERKLRDAFIYLSESFSHRIKLNVYTYNAIIGGVLKEGMCKAAKDIFEEMVEREILLDLSTLKILLAGYCKYRKFIEIKNLLTEVENSGVISLPQGEEDHLSKAFKILGIDYLGLKVKRDNDARVPKAEYFDILGNGLYLETENCEFEKILDKILEDAMSPDFGSILYEECQQGNLEKALRVKNEVVQWGHDLFPETCSQFLKVMCKSSSHLKEAISFLDEEPELWDRLDGDTLNLVVQSLSKNGMTLRARSVLDRMLKIELPVDNASYNAVILGFYNEKNLRRLREYLELLKGINYSPCSNDINILVSCLCNSGMVEDMFMLFDSVTEKFHDLVPSFVTAILKEFSSRGISVIGTVFLEEVFKRIEVLGQSFLMNLTETICQKSYQFLLHFLISSGRTEETLFLKQQALSRRGGHANCVYGVMLNEFCMKGNLREATSQLQEMLANRMFPDDKILNAFVHGFCRQNNLKKALEILAIMLRTHANLSISSYRCLVRGLCVHSVLNGALNLQKLFLVENGPNSTLVFQNILIFSLFQTKNYSLVDALLDNMREKHLLRDTNTCNFLVYGYYKFGIVSKAVEVFYDMMGHGMRPNNRSFRIIICHFCRHGELNKALELSNMMVNNGWKIGSCIQNCLAMSLISSGQLSEALILLDRIEEQELIAERVCYDLLIKELSAGGKVKKAAHLLNIMLKKGSLPSQTSYISVIHGFCIHKAYDEALDFYEEMFQKGLVPSEAFSATLICYLTECGRSDDGRRILGLMLQFGLVPACRMYNSVIRAYYAENNMEKASELVQEMQKAGYSPNFETHWSLISKLSGAAVKENYKGFLSSLLYGDGLPVKNRKQRGVS
ncbi:pentatricopeptide repeat-containing protein At5g15280, mitochondrial isoform X1 [Dendrobium catenatum]|uniref:Pentatricopeptide repeat-containing protein n=1 Tax=Dendrobium catenatum TaxID=906689 RepID=A0A2I0VCQ5_9ASPA|nr:pentatricopeptide repeat-containing protein At5g15280, mitochondrial isoform X1 [Dendrobium catenatum]PKU61193.1 Pentatricopeptide repeat-containing protein [Dendrobium catenatum]